MKWENSILQLVEDGLEVGATLSENIQKSLDKTTEIMETAKDMKPVFESAEKVLA